MADAVEPAEMAALRVANSRLREVVVRQAAELDAAQSENTALLGRVSEAERLIEALTAQVAELNRRLGRNSKNSSMPPSCEGLAKKPAVPRQRGARKAGKQPGTPGRHLARVATPDEIVTHTADVCGGCGADLADAADGGFVSRQVFDLPEVRLRVVEHRAQRRRCGCGTTTTASFPAQASAPACYGPGVRAAIASLCVGQHLPIDRAAQLLADLLGVPIATGTISGAVTRAAEAVAPAVQAIRRALVDAWVAHFDETGARVAGRLHWVHSACTAMLSYFTVHAKRGNRRWTPPGFCPPFRGWRCMTAGGPTAATTRSRTVCAMRITSESCGGSPSKTAGTGPIC
jgi:transposase